MDPEAEGLLMRVLRHATGITATAAAVVLASVAGMSAYQIYQPAALEANAIDATASQQATVSPDVGITSFTLAPDGSIVAASGTVQIVSGSSVGGSQSSAAQTPTINIAADGPPSIGETLAVSPQPPQTPVPPSKSATTTVLSATSTSSHASSTSVSNEAEASTSVSAASATTTEALAEVPTAAAPAASAQTPTDLNGPQPSTPTLNTNVQHDALNTTGGESTGIAPVRANSSESWISRLGNAVKEGSIGAINDIRSWIGLSPLNAGTQPVSTL